MVDTVGTFRCTTTNIDKKYNKLKGYIILVGHLCILSPYCCLLYTAMFYLRFVLDKKRNQSNEIVLKIFVIISRYRQSLQTSHEDDYG